MATITVTTLADSVAADGLLSLREALALADADAARDFIQFADGVRGGTITLDARLGQLVVNSTVDISGGLDEVAVPGDPGTIITAAGNSRVLLVQGGSAGDPMKVSLDRLTITGGATEGSADAGGGILSGASTELTLFNTTVSGNSTEAAKGGGIASFGTLSLTDSTVSDNSTEGPGAGGGGIYAAGTVTLDRSTVSGNSTEASLATGGGIRAATVLATNSTIAGNNTHGESARGGGILASDSVTLVHSTVSDNGTAGRFADGGGIVGGSTLSFTNSIVAGNRITGQTAFGPDLGSAITSSNGHNIFGSAVDGNTTGDLEGIAASALFSGGLAFNGGLTQNLALLESNANPALAGGGSDDPLFGDQRNQARPSPGGTAPDVGAFESAFVPKAELSIAGTAADQAEGNSGTTAFTFTVTRSGELDTAISAQWSVSSTAATGPDFLGGALPTGTVSFAAGAATAIVAVTVQGDTTVEPDEAFAVTLGNPSSGAVVTGSPAAGTIRNDDAAAPEILGNNSANTLNGTTGDDVIRGRGGDDTLNGKAGNDRLFGDNGNDVLWGNAGLDQSTGGAGADRFAFKHASDASPAGPAYEELLGFSRSDGDKIDLRSIDANEVTPGINDAFRFIGGTALSGPGQLRVEAYQGDFLVTASTDADAVAEFAIVVRTGLTALKASDFLL